MGEPHPEPCQLSFHSALRVEFRESRVTSDGGRMVGRALDEWWGMGARIERHRTDTRRGRHKPLPPADVLGQAVYSRLAGYADVHEAERVSADPTLRLSGAENIWERGAALPSRWHACETARLADAANRAGLAAIHRALIGKAEALESPRRGVLDMESPEIPVSGTQEHSADTGSVEATGDHPRLLFHREGDCLAAKRRPGNVHSAEGGAEVLRPEPERQQRHGKAVARRADAAVAKPERYETLEPRGVRYAMRIPANASLERHGAERRPRPVGRPRHKPLLESKRVRSRAAGWNTARSVVATVEQHQGARFARVGCIVTRVSLSRRAVVRFDNRRGPAEQGRKAGQQAAHWTRLWCHRCRAHEVR